MLSLVVTAAAQQKNELRAAWLTNVDSNVLSSDANITEAMDYLASMGINVIFPVVYNKGYTLYPSSVMNTLFNAPVLPGSPFVNRDFLERVVIEAHRNGIEVIPWFEFGFSTSYSLNGGHILAKFPSWALKDNTGKLVVHNGFDWMSPLNPGPQDFMLSLMTEVMDKYDVDGIQGDDRLPAMPAAGGYDSATAALYSSEHLGGTPPSDYNNTAWKQWRAGKLTAYLSRMRDSVKARGNNMILSVSPAPYYWGYNQLLQDSKTWVQMGLVDNIVPQLYQYNMADFNYAINTTWNDVGQYAPKVFTSGILAKVGSYVVDTTFLGQMVNAGRTKGVNGECFFFYEGLRANNNRVGNYLKNKFYQEPALVPYRNGKVWRPKASIVNETEAAVQRTGAWTEYLMKGFTGSIIRTADTSAPAEVRYQFPVQYTAYYDVYTFRTPNTPWTQQARYTLYGETDSSVVIVDQSDLTRKGWYKLGTVKLVAGNRTVLRLDNSLLEGGKYLVTDAVMLMLNRRLSPDVVVGVEDRAAESPVVAEDFHLSHNFPNPFNPATTIRYRLAAEEFVTLTVYDILGKEVATLVSDRQRAGEHTVRFDASSVSSGTYFYTLRAGAASVTRRMLLIK
ncbi:MAG: family 10 glycosylhydrolase [Bacteroidetes bacterium]|nr:family 10 glycosylhydrolase [Bacteroidota bacterium]